MLPLLIFALTCSSCFSFQFSGHVSSLKQQVQSKNQFQTLYAGFGKASEEKASTDVVPSGDSKCLCDSGKKYSDCCQSLHNTIGVKQEVEVDATKVTRARFSALRSELSGYLVASTHPDHKAYVAEDDSSSRTGSKRTKRQIWEKELKRFSEAWEFKDLIFINEVDDSKIPADGIDATVSVSLQRKQKNVSKWETVDETIQFRKTPEGKWAFISNVMSVTKFEASMVGNVKGKGLSTFTQKK
jgi:uncharacterized protein YchJ